MTESRYERLPGKGRHFAGFDTLYLAEDHLLLAEQRAYSQTYRRFFFSDIQALILRRTGTRTVAGLVWVALVLFFGWGLTRAPSTGWIVTLGVVCAGAVTGGLINWFRGPTVRCHLATKLQTVELRSLRREGRARRAIARLRREIEAVQGVIEVGDEPEVAGAVGASGSSTERLKSIAMNPLPSARLSSPPPLPSSYTGRWHLLLFVALLVDSAVTVWQLNSSLTAVHFVALVVFLAELGLAIAAVVKRRTTRVPRRMALVAGSALAFLLVLMVASWILAVTDSVQSAFEAARAGEAVEQTMFSAPSAAHSWASLVGTTLLGLAGLYTYFAERLSQLARRV